MHLVRIPKFINALANCDIDVFGTNTNNISKSNNKIKTNKQVNIDSITYMHTNMAETE